jgi:hypothetical protein
MDSEESGRRDCVQIYQTLLRFLSGEIRLQANEHIKPTGLLELHHLPLHSKAANSPRSLKYSELKPVLPTNLPYSIFYTHILGARFRSGEAYVCDFNPSTRASLPAGVSNVTSLCPSQHLRVAVTSNLRMAKKLCSCSNFPLFVASEFHFRAACFLKVFT